jgi:hypothetical protein
MSSKAEVIRRVELIDELSTILRDLRRSEMEELERIEAEEEAGEEAHVLGRGAAAQELGDEGEERSPPKT